MIKIDDTGAWKLEIGEEIRRIERLLYDMNLLYSEGGYPPAQEFSRARLIMNPKLAAVQMLCLAGMIIGGDEGAEPGLTGLIKVVAQDGSWVRCSDRLYRVEQHG
nr:F30 [uncultured bacterium]